MSICNIFKLASLAQMDLTGLDPFIINTKPTLTWFCRYYKLAVQKLSYAFPERKHFSDYSFYFVFGCP
jgi:hypothetical protein